MKQNYIKKIAKIALMSGCMCLTACGAKGTNSYNNAKMDWSTESYDGMEAEADYSMNYTSNSGSYADGELVQTSTAVYEKKIIRDGNMDLETTNVLDTYKTIFDYIKNSGGYEFAKQQHSSELYTSIDVTFKVTPDKLDEVMEFIATCCDVTNSNVSSSDITSEYYDTKVRLENKRKNLEKYYEYLENARNIDELIQLQNQIDKITVDIETYEGMIKMWDTLVNESTLDLQIYQKNDPNAVEEKFEWNSISVAKMGRMMSNGFQKTCNVLFSILQWIVISLITLLPVIIIAGIILFICLRVNKKKKQRRLNERKKQQD